MIVLKVATVFLLALSVGAEKKIELQDIEEDNLKSEKESVHKSDQSSQGGIAGPGLVPFDFLKSNILRYLSNQPLLHQQRYVHQYAVTEPPERSSAVPVGTAQYSQPTVHSQPMVGYISNIPMQVYLIPQYYTDHVPSTNQQITHQSHQASLQYQPSAVSRVAAYQPAPEAGQAQTNYIEIPAYITPTGKSYVQQYTPPVFVGYPAQPTAAPTQAVTPVVAYQVPILEYSPTAVHPTAATKTYYSNPTTYTDNNSVDDVHQDHEEQKVQYSTPKDISFKKPFSEFPRHYNSRVPVRDDYRSLHSNTITELPHPNPLLLRVSPPHLAHLPKALPMYRPLTKAVYQGGHIGNALTPRPHDVYGPPTFKRRPTSLLDSYIPSTVQLEYLKRGLVKEPSAVYDALTTGRLPHPIPRNYERGFLPNQMYHTAAGGVTYGHYKRTPKADKVQQ